MLKRLEIGDSQTQDRRRKGLRIDFIQTPFTCFRAPKWSRSKSAWNIIWDSRHLNVLRFVGWMTSRRARVAGMA